MLKRILKYKNLLIINVIVVLLVSFAEVFQALLFGEIADNVTGTNMYPFYYLIIGTVVFVTAVFVLESLSKRSAAALNRKVMVNFKQQIIDNFIKSNMKNKIDNSEIISILNNDVKLIEDSYVRCTISIAKDILLLIIALVVILNINIYLAITVIGLSWVPVVFPQLFINKNKKLKDDYSNNLKKFLSKVKETAQGFDVIKGFNIEDKIRKIVFKSNDDLENSKFKSEAFEGVMGAISISSGMGIFFINLLIAGYLVSKKMITIGEMLAFIQLMNYVVNPLMSVSAYMSKIRSVSNIVNKIEIRLSENNEEQKYSEEFDFNKEIKINNLTFSYDGQKDVLSNINLSLEKGKKYAIVGDSGSGKSTLLKILLNQINDYKGTVCIDSKNLSNINPESFYKNVNLLQQNVYVFNDTIKNNICLYNQFSDELISKAITKSGLDKVISNQKEGINTIIGEDSVQLSGGETQRIAIARSLIRNSNILLLDEATSALDKVTSKEIENVILNLDKTVISVTHQLYRGSLERYDEIIVLKDGSIIEHGTFEELIASKNYFYYMYTFKDENEASESKKLAM